MYAIVVLTKKVDDNSIKNEDIRKAIIELRKFCSSIGASQKVINVYLKFYCIISNKDDKILQELDCPIDSEVIKYYNLKKIRLINLDLKEYKIMQEELRKREGMRIIAEIKAYDTKKQ